MRNDGLLLFAAPFVLAVPSLAQAAEDQPTDAPDAAASRTPAKPPVEVLSTGVAKGRDRLDSATSTSSLRGDEIQKFGPRPLADVLRTMAGLRVESGIGEGNNNYTVRGLPLAAGGSKYMQFQEDGLPILEFGDLFNIGTDVYLRNDFTVAQIETIRGGSASTFASNSPGGLINVISRTGDVEGGSVQASSGLDFDQKRVDFTYGARLGANLRFQVGGFFRQGEGPRHIGFDGWRGGQVKLNVTREFAGGGYLRLYLKLLDDRSPTYAPYFVNITGTDSDPKFNSFKGFKLNRDSVLSTDLGPVVTLDENNQLAALPLSTGQHAISKSVGLESQFDVAGWTVTERMRYSANSGDFNRAFPSSANTVANFAAAQGGAGASAVYASGPLAGQPISTATPINGNGLLALYYVSYVRAHSLDNFTNDLRATRVWKLSGGDLTTTLGAYYASQKLQTTWLHTAMDIDVNGGKTAMVDIISADGTPQTQDGYYAFARGTSLFRRAFDVDYRVFAPYGSINYHFGKIAIGGSLRYDTGRVRGSLVGADLGGGRNGLISYDINGDGQISAAEQRVAYLPLTQPAPVRYNYGYLSYSAGVNYRVAEPFSLFARYSLGARANADKILFTPVVSTTDGSVASSRDKADRVRQLEGGFKFRKDGMTLNVTAFRVTADDHNVLNGSANRTDRSYRATGVELEGGLQRGIFSLMLGATYTKAKITADRLDPTLTGHEPRHQPDWTFTATPQVDFGKAAIGASVVAITKSYAQDSNLLVMPGFTTVGAYATFRPVDRVSLSVNAQNLFDTVGIFEVNQSTVPANGIGFARSVNGRTVQAALRFDF